jgi:hypothetical protein
MNHCSWRGGIALVVDVVRAYMRLISASWSCVSRIWNDCGRLGVAVMRAQHAVAQAVERADPHAARVDRRQRGRARQHLARRLVGERDGEDRQRARLPGREQPRDARRQHARLAAAGAGEDQRRRVRQRDGGELLGLSVREEAMPSRRTRVEAVERCRTRRSAASARIIGRRGRTGVRQAIIARLSDAIEWPRAPDDTPPANSATMRAFVHWIRAAAPYVHAFRGKTFVIAFGGEVVADESFLGIVHDLNLLHSLGIKLVVVHGCRPQVEAILKAQDIRAATRTACASPTPMRWTACSRPPARCARASRRSCRSASRTRRWPARAIACRAATTSPPSRWAWSTASTCSSPARVRRIDTEAIAPALEDGDIVLISPIGYSPTGEIFNLTVEEVATQVRCGMHAAS